jgi:hypothetical protein
MASERVGNDQLSEMYDLEALQRNRYCHMEQQTIQRLANF